MALTIANWYVNEKNLHWWTDSTVGTSRGKDHAGRSGNFVGNSVKISSWQEFDGGFFRFVGADGRRYDAAFATHYKNKAHPNQCVKDKEELLAKLPK